MKILVSGATGFVGGYLLRYLTEKFPDAEVVGTGRSKEKAEKLKKEGYALIIGDISDPEFVKNELNTFTHIIHSAARSSIWGKYEDFYRDNVLATRNLLEGIDKLERFIYISTANIYFNLNDRLNVKEDDFLPKKRVSHYPLTKHMAETEVLNYSKKQVHTISLRPRGILGPGDTTSMPRIMRAYLEDKIKVIGNGKNIVDFTSVKNLAHAVVLSINAAPETNGQAYNITDGTTHAFWPLMNKSIAKLGLTRKIGKLNYPIVYAYACMSELRANLNGGREPALTRYAAAVMKVSFTLNITKATEQLGYKPIITTEQCIDDYLAWAKETKAFG